MMTTKRRSFYIDTWGPDADAIRDAFQWLAQVVVSTPSSEGLLVVPLKEHLRRESVLTKVLGSGRLAKLDRGGSVRLNGGSLSAATTKTLPYQFNGPVVALWLNDNYMDRIDAILGATDVLAVPFLKNGVRRWVDTWEAEEINGAGRGTRPTPDPVVRAALDNLGTFVNEHALSTDDEFMAVETFIVLRDGGVPFTADQVRSYLMAEHDFPPTTANAIAERADKILAGKRLRRGDDRLGRDSLAYWRKKAGV